MNQPIISCTPCPLRATCTQPCAEVEALLPNEDAGRISALQRRHAWLHGMKLKARQAYVRRLLDGRGILRWRMKRAFSLRYDYGLSISEIGRRMRIPPSLAGTYLRRARQEIHRSWAR